MAKKRLTRGSLNGRLDSQKMRVYGKCFLWGEIRAKAKKLNMLGILDTCVLFTIPSGRFCQPFRMPLTAYVTKSLGQAVAHDRSYHGKICLEMTQMRSQITWQRSSRLSTGDGPRIDNAIDKVRAACMASGEPRVMVPRSPHLYNIHASWMYGQGSMDPCMYIDKAIDRVCALQPWLWRRFREG